MLTCHKVVKGTHEKKTKYTNNFTIQNKSMTHQAKDLDELSAKYESLFFFLNSKYWLAQTLLLLSATDAKQILIMARFFSDKMHIKLQLLFLQRSNKVPLGCVNVDAFQWTNQHLQFLCWFCPKYVYIHFFLCKISPCFI